MADCECFLPTSLALLNLDMPYLDTQCPGDDVYHSSVGLSVVCSFGDTNFNASIRY